MKCCPERKINLMSMTHSSAVEKGSALRRSIHVLTGLGSVYYFIPEKLLPWLDRETGLVLVLLVVLAFESVRIQLSLKILGMRPYEYTRLSGFAWAFLGIGTVVLFFPFYIAVPALASMALMDPLAGELRARGATRLPDIILPLSFAIYLVSFVLFHLPLVTAAPLALAGSLIAWLSERLKFRSIDDDFLMSVLPAVGILALRTLL